MCNCGITEQLVSCLFDSTTRKKKNTQKPTNQTNNTQKTHNQPTRNTPSFHLLSIFFSALPETHIISEGQVIQLSLGTVLTWPLLTQIAKPPALRIPSSFFAPPGKGQLTGDCFVTRARLFWLSQVSWLWLRTRRLSSFFHNPFYKNLLHLPHADL